MSRLFAAANKRPCPGYPGSAHEEVPDLFPRAPFGSQWTNIARGGGNNEWHLMNGNSNGGAQQQQMQCQQQQQQIILILEHLVLPSDTFGGLCLRYKISANKLRQWNRFSGSNLSLVPSKLYIPVTRSTTNSPKKVMPQDTQTEEYKVTCMTHFVPSLSRKVAAAYLRICSWDIQSAIEEAQGDLDWEVHHESLMLDRILSLRDRKQHEAEEARYSVRQRRTHRQQTNFCVKAFETFLQDHGVKLTKTNNKEMWFEMSHEKPAAQKMSRTPSAASLTSSDGNSSVEDDLFAGEYGVTNIPTPSNNNQYSVKYDMSSHQLQTRSFQPYGHGHSHHHLGEEVKAAALMVEQKLLDVLALFQNREDQTKLNKDNVAFHEDETVSFFEMSDMSRAVTGGKSKVA